MLEFADHGSVVLHVEPAQEIQSHDEECHPNTRDNEHVIGGDVPGAGEETWCGDDVSVLRVCSLNA